MSEKLEIYKLAVEMSDRVSSRRLTANGFFLSINTTLIGILSFFYTELLSSADIVLVILPVVGMVLSLTWLFSIRSYKQLNKAKFTVINAIEKDLSYQYFTDEWEVLKRQTQQNMSPVFFSKMRDRWLRFKDRYTELTNIEAIVPFLFMLMYIVVLVSAFLN